MKFRYSPVALAVFAALGSAGLTPVAAQQAQPQAQSLERVTITGSNIRRTDQETVAPVEIITREQIERTGQPTVSDVLKSIPMSLGSLGESFSNSFAPGAQGISLRGLGQKSTLVLHQRSPHVRLRLRAEPPGHLRRPERDSVLGGRADRDPEGRRLGHLRFGRHRRRGQRHPASRLPGHRGRRQRRLLRRAERLPREHRRRLRRPRQGQVQRLRRARLLQARRPAMSDTKFGETRDYRGEDGGRNFQSLTAGGTWHGVTATANASQRAPGRSPSAAAPIDYQHGGRGLLRWAQSAGAAGQHGAQPAGQHLVRAATSTTRSGAARNRADRLPRPRHVRLLGHDAGLRRSRLEPQSTSLRRSRSRSSAATTGPPALPVPAALAPSPYNVNFAPGAAGNPLADNARSPGDLNDIGPRDTDVTSDTYRVLAGSKYTLGGWDFDSAVGWSKNEVEADNINRLSQRRDRRLRRPEHACSRRRRRRTNSQYNLDPPSTNSPAVRDVDVARTAAHVRIRTEVHRHQGDDRARHTCRAAPIGLAPASSSARSRCRDRPDRLARQWRHPRPGHHATDGERDNLALYGELALPITRQLEAQLALRYDDYSDFGSSTTPKVGLKFRPAPELLLRANWGRGFKAPSLPEITPSSAFFFTFVEDPAIPGVLRRSPARSTRTRTWSPRSRARSRWGSCSSRTATSARAWTTTRSSGPTRSPSRTSRTIANDPDYDPNVSSADPGTGVSCRSPASTSTWARWKTQGVDLDVRYKRAPPTAASRPAWRDVHRLVPDQRRRVAGTNLAWVYSNTSAIPRWKGQWSFDWEQGPWVAQLTVNYIHQLLADVRAGDGAQLLRPGHGRGGIPQTGTLDPKSPSYTTFDLYGRYMVTPNLGVSASWSTSGRRPDLRPVVHDDVLL